MTETRRDPSVNLLYRYTRLVMRSVHQANTQKGVSGLQAREERRAAGQILAKLMGQEATCEDLDYICHW